MDDGFKRYLEEQYRRWQRTKNGDDERTISEMWGDWVGQSPPHIKRRDGWIRRWLEVRFDLGDRVVSLAQLSMSEATPEALKLWLAALATAPAKRTSTICPGTIQMIRMALQAMFTHYLEKGTIDRNPLRKAAGVPRVPGSDKARYGYVDRELMERIAREMPPIGGFFLRHLWVTACRFRSLQTLRREQIDRSASELVLQVKGGKTRRVPVGAKTIDEMGKLAGVSPSNFVYPNPRDPAGGPIPQSTLYEWLGRACSSPAVGVTEVAGEKITFHHFRHGRANDVLSGTKDITQVKAILTHSSVRTTERYIRDALIRKELHKFVKND